MSFKKEMFNLIESMTSKKLNEINYTYRARSVKVLLHDRDLFNHFILDRPSVKSSKRDFAKADLLNNEWDQEDNAIIGLMNSSIEPHIEF